MICQHCYAKPATTKCKTCEEKVCMFCSEAPTKCLESNKVISSHCANCGMLEPPKNKIEEVFWWIHATHGFKYFCRFECLEAFFTENIEFRHVGIGKNG